MRTWSALAALACQERDVTGPSPFSDSEIQCSHETPHRSAAASRSHGRPRQGPGRHPRLHARVAVADAERDRSPRAAARRHCAPLPAHARRARLRHAVGPQFPAAPEGARARRRVSRIDEHRDADQDLPGGSRAPDRRLGRAHRARRHGDRVRGAHVGAHADATGSARRQPLSRLSDLDGPRAARRAQRRAPAEVFRERAVRRADQSHRDGSGEADEADRGMPARRLLRGRGRTGVRRRRGRRAGLRSVAARGRGAEQLEPLEEDLQGQAGARAPRRCCRSSARRSRASCCACPACRSARRTDARDSHD